MGSTTKKALRWPTPTVGVKPNVAQDIRNLAEDVDGALSNPTSISGTDLNAITASGLYQGNGLANAPLSSANTFLVHALYRDSGTQVQTAYNMADGTRWARGTASGTWKGWARLPNAEPGDISSADLNTIAASGTYQGGNLGNAPVGSTNSFLVEVIYRDSSNQLQTAHNLADSTHWWRMMQGGTWKPWAQIADSSNDTGWTLAPITPASGWGTKTDPKGNTTGTLKGGVRAVGKFVEYRFQLTRTGGAISSSASGNIGGDPVIANVSPTQWPGLVPSSIVDDAFDVIGVQAGVARIDDAGQITISALYPNDSINTGDVIQVSLRFLAG